MPGRLLAPHKVTGILAVDFLHVDAVLMKRLYVLVFIEDGPYEPAHARTSEPSLGNRRPRGGRGAV
jgi:hypothetical protein